MGNLSVMNAAKVLWLIALDVNDQSIDHRTGHTNCGTARNGIRAPVKRIGIIAKFTPATGCNYIGCFLFFIYF